MLYSNYLIKYELAPVCCTMLKIKICEVICNLRHDSGSQYTIISKETCDKLVTKPPLQPVSQSRIAVDVSVFSFDSVIHFKI